MRFLFYSHDGVGLGHVRRHLAIAAALADAAPSAQVLLATSIDEVSNLGLPPNVDTLKLPSLRKVANNQYASRRLSLPTAEIRALRSDILLAATRSFRPAVVLVDKHPFGAGGEFRAALEAARALGARTVLGLRDILDDAARVLREWTPAQIQEQIPVFFDLVLIYGQRSIYDVCQQYRFAAAVTERTRYCGYVVNKTGCVWHSMHCPYLLVPPGQHPAVLATTGGGEDGFNLLQTFIAAATGAPWKGIVVAGPMLGQRELKTLEKRAGSSGVSFHTFLPCLPSLFGDIDALVCMGGYNTLVEAMSQGVPVVCVPRAVPRAEQVLRAKALEKLGLLRTIHPRRLSVDRLREQITRTLAVPRAALLERCNRELSFTGAQRAAVHLLDLRSQLKRTPEGQLAPLRAR